MLHKKKSANFNTDDVISCSYDVSGIRKKKPEYCRLLHPSINKEGSMPTSSQAMILRGTETVRSPTVTVSYKNITPFSKVDLSYQKTPLGRGERVQFDISVCPKHEKSIDGFEGVYAYDHETQTYRWQLFTVSPKALTDFAIDKHEIGDCNSHDETNANTNDIMRQSSFDNGHFTTPTESRIDNTPVDYKHGWQIKSPRGETDFMDDAVYRRFEELGFRRRTTRTPRGSVVRANRAKPSARKSPRRSTSELIDTKCVPKLSVRDLNRESPLKENISTNSSFFLPQSFVSGGSMRKR
jgi:hypothetical protein